MGMKTTKLNMKVITEEGEENEMAEGYENVFNPICTVIFFKK